MTLWKYLLSSHLRRAIVICLLLSTSGIVIHVVSGQNNIFLYSENRGQPNENRYFYFHQFYETARVNFTCESCLTPFNITFTFFSYNKDQDNITENEITIVLSMVNISSSRTTIDLHPGSYILAIRSSGLSAPLVIKLTGKGFLTPLFIFYLLTGGFSLMSLFILSWVANQKIFFRR